MNFHTLTLSKDYNKLISFEYLFENEFADNIIEIVGNKEKELKVFDLVGGTGKFS
jgi:hypothetical protein